MLILGSAAFLNTQRSLDIQIKAGWFEDMVEKGQWYFVGNRQAERKIVLFGDSQMEHFARQMVDKLGDDFALDFLTLGNCYVSKSKAATAIANKHKEEAQKRCQTLREHLLDTPTPDVVITSNNWRIFETLPKTPEEFKEGIMDKVAIFNPPPKLMIFIGSPGELDLLCESAFARRIRRKEITCRFLKDPQVHLDFIEWSKSQKFPDFVRFVYPFLDWCDVKMGKCQSRNEQGLMVFWDATHLSYVGGEKTAQKITDIIRQEFPKENPR